MKYSVILSVIAVVTWSVNHNPASAFDYQTPSPTGAGSAWNSVNNTIRKLTSITHAQSATLSPPTLPDHIIKKNKYNIIKITIKNI